MNFDFSDDQRLLQAEVGKMLAQCSTSAEVRQSLSGDAPYSKTVWRTLIEMGAASAAIPEAYGGAGLGYLELCLVAEEAGRYLATAPLSSSIYLAAEALSLGGDETQKSTWLPRLAAGELIATVALQMQESYLNLAAPQFDGAHVSGQFSGVVDGLVAGLAIVQVGAQLLLVDLDQSGVTRQPQTSLDPTRPLAALSFERVPAQALGQADANTIARLRNGAAVLVAFEQLGGASRALELARTYSLERKAFGRVIGGFQALKHKMADIYTQIELARVHAYYGAWALSSGAAELPLAAAAARVAATTAFNLAAEENIEIHGGIGFTWEMDCHLYYRRARHLALLLGSEHLWRSQLADELIKQEAA